MQQLSIFGQDLSDYEIDLIVEDPRVREFYRHDQRIAQAVQRYRYDQSARGMLMRYLQAGMKATSIATLFYNIVKSHREKPNKRDEENPTNIRKRAHSDDFVTPVKARRVGHNTISPEQSTMRRIGNPDEFERRGTAMEMDIDDFGRPAVVNDRGQRGLPAPGDVEMSVARSAGTQSSSTRSGVAHGETPTDGYFVAKKTPWPDTDTILHNYYHFLPAQQIVPGAVATQVISRSFRLNSIYDCEDNSAYSSAEVTRGQADAADGAGSRQIPTWVTHYGGYYNYWSVLSSKYRIRILVYPNAGDQKLTQRELQLMVYVYHHGAQKPPVPTDTNLIQDFQFRKNHDGMYYFPISYRPEAGFNMLDQMDLNACSGDWSPGSIKHEVAEDELKQIWQQLDQVPPTREGLTIMILPSPNNTFSGAIDVRMEVSIDYTCQWKDLKAQYQYLLPSVDQQTTANSATQTTL